jgi:hypothetical protein
MNRDLDFTDWNIDGLNTPRAERTWNVLLMLAVSLALHGFNLYAPWSFRTAELKFRQWSFPIHCRARVFRFRCALLFLVFKGAPLLGVATNNAAPRLALFDDGVEFRVITRQRRRYEDLERVDARQKFGTQNLILHWRHNFFAFSGNLGAEAPLIALLRFFGGRGIELTKESAALAVKYSQQKTRAGASQ